MPLVSLRPYRLNLKNSAFDPRLSSDISVFLSPTPYTLGRLELGISRQLLADPHIGASQRGDSTRPRVRALTSGKFPAAKTIISDVFPQPPSPTRTTLTERPLSGASSPAAWAAFIPSGRAGGQPCAEQRVVRDGLAAAGAGLARRDRNVEGAGRREEVGAGRPGQEAARGAGDTQLR